ncbi:hypothetical protein C9E85_05410 [Plesiomonas shigelloides]|uniref:hypothetical protein n=1 Tax=Plesiomonas shigelloides TaxID=703 RepID=UPI000D57EA24|nr:hypothetical protein [Plesiomonas shigelloides]PVU67076.1 hypothetical protein C9E85_05410 [Plesiomonas shigelloides]
MDITTITSAYTAIKNIKEITKLVLDAKIDAEVSEKIQASIERLGEVQDTLFYIREELLTQQEEKENLKKELASAKAELEKVESVIYRAPSYWIVNKDQPDGPFCQPCFDDERKLIRLQGGDNDIWNCRKCKNTFHGPNYVVRQNRVRRSPTWKL